MIPKFTTAKKDKNYKIAKAASMRFLQYNFW